MCLADLIGVCVRACATREDGMGLRPRCTKQVDSSLRGFDCYDYIFTD